MRCCDIPLYFRVLLLVTLIEVTSIPMIITVSPLCRFSSVHSDDQLSPAAQAPQQTQRGHCGREGQDVQTWEESG